MVSPSLWCNLNIVFKVFYLKYCWLGLAEEVMICHALLFTLNGCFGGILSPIKEIRSYLLFDLYYMFILNFFFYSRWNHYKTYKFHAFYDSLDCCLSAYLLGFGQRSYWYSLYLVISLYIVILKAILVKVFLKGFLISLCTYFGHNLMFTSLT